MNVFETSPQMCFKVLPTCPRICTLGFHIFETRIEAKRSQVCLQWEDLATFLKRSSMPCPWFAGSFLDCHVLDNESENLRHWQFSTKNILYAMGHRKNNRCENCTLLQSTWKEIGRIPYRTVLLQDLNNFSHAEKPCWGQSMDTRWYRGEAITWEPTQLWLSTSSSWTKFGTEVS